MRVSAGLMRHIYISAYCPYASQTNTYQAVVITDGSESFAIFTYLCGAMAWHGNATIGFNAGGTWFENHVLSGTAGANSIACTNRSSSVWTNVVYKLTPRGMSYE